MYSSLAVVVVLLGAVAAQEEDPLDALAQNVPGVPGEDYPIYALPPDTTFVCNDRIPGYYADPESDCQMYHICAGPATGLVKYDFLCPNGTLFDQQYFVCNWWFNVDCGLAESLYSLNEDVLAAMEAANPTDEDREGKAGFKVEAVNTVGPF